MAKDGDLSIPFTGHTINWYWPHSRCTISRRRTSKTFRPSKKGSGCEKGRKRCRFLWDQRKNCFNSVGHCCQDSQKMGLVCCSSSQNLDPENPRLLELWQEEFERRRLRLKHVVKLRQLLWVVWGRYSLDAAHIAHVASCTINGFYDFFLRSPKRNQERKHRGWGKQDFFLSKGSKNVKKVRQNNCYIAYMETQFALELIGDDRWWPWNTANWEKICLYLLPARTSQRMA